MKILGVDPGLRGGVACLDTDTRQVVAIHMPTRQRKDKNEIDSATLGEWIRSTGAVVAYVEDVHAMPGQGVTSMFTFGRGVGVLDGVLSMIGLPIRYVSPVTWQKKIFHERTRGDKSIAIRYVMEMYPEFYINTPKFGDGMADAICIAEYGACIESKEVPYDRTI